ncbi:helix-turn-helix transcriptional regulator [Rhodopirellula europaea]|uniref:helix-turn-helix transcriptional regulator n=1 Tax=Rhodopirellula europaea TaxID=1263866 RepID=UPI003D29A8DB
MKNAQPQSNNRPLTKKEVAEYFSVSPRTIDRWVEDKTLPSSSKVVIGGTVRFRPEVLRDHLAELSGE